MSNDVTRVGPRVARRCTGRRERLAHLRRAAALLAGVGFAVAAAACSDSAAAPQGTSHSYLRIVNDVFQINATDTVPVAIDFLIDSAPGAPSALNVAAVGISPGDSGNGYITLSPGLHSFVARRAGDTSQAGSFYTNVNNAPYLPKQVLTAGTYYTLVVSGNVPATGPVPNGTFPLNFLIDDPFPGPVYDGIPQARFRLVHAAPYADAAGTFNFADLYVTKGSTVPVDVSNVVPSASFIDMTQGSASVNVNAGSYVITVKTTFFGQTLAQQVVDFASGDVKTIVLQSTVAGKGDATGNKITAILDHHHAQ